MNEEYLINVPAASRAYRLELAKLCRRSSASSHDESYLENMAIHEGVRAQQLAVQSELSEAMAQIEEGLTAIRGIISAHGLRPSALNDRIEGLQGCESFAVQVVRLREAIGRPPA